MEWNPVLEDRLKRSSQSAGWRWIGYFAVVLGMLAGLGGYGLHSALASEACGQQAFTEACQRPSVWLFVGPGLAFFALGIAVALPAEKAAKEARELKIQKAAAQTASSRPAVQAVERCHRCSTILPAGARFCGACGTPAIAVPLP